MEIDREMGSAVASMDSTQPQSPRQKQRRRRGVARSTPPPPVLHHALSVATFVTQPRRDEHYALPCLLLAIGWLLMVAAFVANGGSFRCSRGTLALGELERAQNSSSWAPRRSSIEITIRLLARNASRSHIEFRLRTKSGGERNRAFTADFNSFGHCVQGCLSVLLVPASGAACHGRQWTRPSRVSA